MKLLREASVHDLERICVIYSAWNIVINWTTTRFQSSGSYIRDRFTLQCCLQLNFLKDNDSKILLENSFESHWK